MSQSNQEAEHSAIAKLFANCSQLNPYAGETADRIIDLVGQLACIEADSGNRQAIKVACRCYAELNRKSRPISPILHEFILKRIEMVADGHSREAFPSGRSNWRPNEFDGLGFVIALVREWAESDVPSSDFDKFVRDAIGGKLGDKFGLKPDGNVFDVKTFQRSIDNHLPKVLSLLSIEANLRHK